MVNLRLLKAAVNCVGLGVDLNGHAGARIYRSRRASGPYEEVGLAFEETYTDAVHLEPGKTYFYRAVAWRAPSLYPEADSLAEGRPVSARVPRAPRERRVVLTRKRKEFTATMGGRLDESNTVTVGPEVYCPGPNSSMPPYEQAFEPNLYVTLENLGETDVENPWVVVNGQRDWWSVETMVREIAGIAGGGREVRFDLAIERAFVQWVYGSYTRSFGPEQRLEFERALLWTGSVVRLNRIIPRSKRWKGGRMHSPENGSLLHPFL